MKPFSRPARNHHCSACKQRKQSNRIDYECSYCNLSNFPGVKWTLQGIVDGQYGWGVSVYFRYINDFHGIMQGDGTWRFSDMDECMKPRTQCFSRTVSGMLGRQSFQPSLRFWGWIQRFWFLLICKDDGTNRQWSAHFTLGLLWSKTERAARRSCADGDGSDRDRGCDDGDCESGCDGGVCESPKFGGPKLDFQILLEKHIEHTRNKTNQLTYVLKFFGSYMAPPWNICL